MSFIAKIRQFFGFKPQNKPTPSPTLVTVYKAKLAAIQTAERQQFFAVEKERALAGYSELKKEASTISPHAGHVFFEKAREHFELENLVYKDWIATQKGSQEPTGSGLAEYEQILGHITDYAKPLAQNSLDVLPKIDAYIQKYEEYILLAEARGEYTFGVSENKKWIRWSFTHNEHFRAARKAEATKFLSNYFAFCPELEFLEMTTHVPWLPISFLEIGTLAKGKTMAGLFVPATNDYYSYIYS